MNDYLNQALRLLTNEWQSLTKLKESYNFIAWESLVYYGKAEMRIEYIDRPCGYGQTGRHYYRLIGDHK